MAKNKKSGSKSKSNANSGSADLARQAASANTKKQNSQKQGKKKGGLIAYIKGVRQELSKVVWPTREELVTDTVVVIATVIFFAVAFWLVDTTFLAALKGLLGITMS